jgi:hypothetical protein
MASEFRPPFNWRDHLKVHPAADLFPLLSEAKLKELAEDIEENGLKTPIVLWSERLGDPKVLVDGRNRLDALALLGWLGPPRDRFTRERIAKHQRYINNHPIEIDEDADRDFVYWDRPLFHVSHTDDVYSLVLSLNAHRRHLTPAQLDEVIAKVLKARPELSHRQIGTMTKTDKNKVAKVRAKMEVTGAVAPVEKTVGADGKARKRSAKRKTDEAALRKGMRSASKSANQNGSRLTPAPTGCDLDDEPPEGSAEQRGHAAVQPSDDAEARKAHYAVAAPERSAEPQASDAANTPTWKSKVTKVELLRTLEPILALAFKDDVASISDGDAALYDALESAKAVIVGLQTVLRLHQNENRRKAVATAPPIHDDLSIPEFLRREKHAGKAAA